MKELEKLWEVREVKADRLSFMFSLPFPFHNFFNFYNFYNFYNFLKNNDC